MNKPPAQTILRWLRDNKIPLGALTNHDTRALLAAVQVAELWLNGDWENRCQSATAFNAVVMQMQPHTRFMAFHAVAHVGDWCHRAELWAHAALPMEDIIGKPECAWGPRRAEKQAATAPAAA